MSLYEWGKPYENGMKLGLGARGGKSLALPSIPNHIDPLVYLFRANITAMTSRTFILNLPMSAWLSGPLIFPVCKQASNALAS